MMGVEGPVGLVMAAVSTANALPQTVWRPAKTFNVVMMAAAEIVGSVVRGMYVETTGSAEPHAIRTVTVFPAEMMVAVALAETAGAMRPAREANAVTAFQPATEKSAGVTVVVETAEIAGKLNCAWRGAVFVPRVVH